MNIRQAFKRLSMLMLISILFLLISGNSDVKAEETDSYGVDLAFGRRVVSSPHTDGNLNVHAVDADPSTRYASIEADDAFFYIDLGSKEKIKRIVIDWEAAYASSYQILVSNDAVNWNEVALVENDEQTTDDIVFDHYLEVTFVKFQGVTRATSYGYSFYSFEVYGPRSLSAGTVVDTVSSHEHEEELNMQYMVDNFAHTRWASEVADDQYVLFDLLEAKTFDMVRIRWEVSFARVFKVYAHEDTDAMPDREDEGWYEITGSDVGLGEVDALPLDEDVDSRFLKLELIQRETSENTKKTGRYPWESTFSIYSFELFDWDTIDAIPVGQTMEFSQNSPAWPSMTNIRLNESGLLLAPLGYPIEADGVVTNLESIADGDIPGFESYAVYNPGVIYDDEREMFHMIYRSELPDHFGHYFGSRYELGHMSTLSYASSFNGVDFERGANNPVVWPTLPEENGGGTEDPRIFKIENDPNRDGKTTYYITYTMYNNQMTRQGILYTHDFETFEKVGSIAPDYNQPLKSGSFLTDPEGNAVKINDPRPGKTGKVYMIYMKDGAYTRIGFTDDVLRIEPEDIVDIDTSGFSNRSIEALTKWNESCMAITNIYGKNDDNIYLMYGGTVLSDENIQYEQPNASGWFYALGALKTTQANPFELTNGTLDLDEPSIHPTDTNKIDYGLFEKCMFADQMIRKDNQWYLYYGAGDMYVGLALARADFSAGAVLYERTDMTLKLETWALNKSFDDRQVALDVELVIEIRDLDGVLIDTVMDVHEIPHFTHLDLGAYSRGVHLTHELDLGLLGTDEYVITSYVRDQSTGEALNESSHYLSIQASVSRTPK